MLILSFKNVEYCYLYCKVAGQVVKLSGMAYRGRVFTKGEVYDPSQKREAILRAREILDGPKDILLVLVKSSKGYTVWYAHEELQVIKIETRGSHLPKGAEELSLLPISVWSSRSSKVAAGDRQRELVRT